MYPEQPDFETPYVFSIGNTAVCQMMGLCKSRMFTKFPFNVSQSFKSPTFCTNNFHILTDRFFWYRFIVHLVSFKDTII